MARTMAGRAGVDVGCGPRAVAFMDFAAARTRRYAGWRVTRAFRSANTLKRTIMHETKTKKVILNYEKSQVKILHNRLRIRN